MGNNQDKCAVCSEGPDGNPLVSPGCCNGWYHHDCLRDQISNKGCTTCSQCNTLYSAAIIQAHSVPTAIAQAISPNIVQENQFQQIPAQANMFFQPPATLNHAPTHDERVDIMQWSKEIKAIMNAAGSNKTSSIDFLSARMQEKYGESRKNQLLQWVINLKNRPRQSNPAITSAAPQNEDPVENWITPVSLALNNSSAAITIDSIPELPQLSLNSAQSFYTVISVSSSSVNTDMDVESNRAATEAIQESSNKPPLDIICVLDTSGSMISDSKLVNLKHAVSFIREELTDKDRMGVITFETSSVNVHPLLRMNAANIAATEHSIASLQPGGGTNILCGLQAAYKMLAARQTKNPISSVFLLTDGIDGGDLKQKKIVAKKIKDMGCSLFVFGFGNDHDSAHLKAIADAGEGLFTFVEKSDMVMDAFGGALGAEKSIFATNLCLTIKPQNGVKITDVDSGNYRNTNTKIRTCVYFPNLMIGEQRDVLLTLSVPSLENPTNSFGLLSTAMRYSLVGSADTAPQESLTGSTCTIQRLGDGDLDTSIRRNVDVDVQVNRVLLAKATEESLALADRNDYAGAVKRMEDTRKAIEGSESATLKHKKAMAFVGEIDATKECVSNRDVYSSAGGRAMMMEANQTVSHQKCTYTKSARSADMYQNASSANYQQSAANKKAKL